MKSDKGASIVTLCLSIIGLLILAGITINLIIGENGIINKVNIGKTTQVVATFRNSLKSGINNVSSIGKDLQNAKTIETTIEEDIKSAINNVKVTFIRPEVTTETGEVTLLSDEGVYTDGQKLKIIVEDDSSNNILQSANISKIEVEIQPATWKVETGKVTYVKPVDGATIKTF